MNLTKLAVAFVIVLFATLIFLLPQTSPKKNPGEQVKAAKTNRQLPSLYKYPTKSQIYQNVPQTSAKSAIVVDFKTEVVLYQKESEQKLLPASTTKLMTALVALEKCEPQRIITVSNSFTKEQNLMGLETGDQLTVETLLYGLLVSSANDAAYTLANSCADSQEKFVSEMNLKAKELNMHNTQFRNPAGFDDPAQYSTAKDLAKLAKVAIANPLIAKIVSTKHVVLWDITMQKIYPLENINELLGKVEGVEGIKTGLTEGSLQVLITQTTREGNTIIAVVLGSQDRFLDSKNLIEWAFANHIWVSP